MAIEFLTVSEVEGLHEEQLALHGGLGGVRDRGALESAVATPQATFGAVFLHSGVFEMAALTRTTSRRTSRSSTETSVRRAALVFLGLNGWDIEDPDERLYDAMIGLSAGMVSKNDLSRTFEALLFRMLTTTNEHEPPNFWLQLTAAPVVAPKIMMGSDMQDTTR